MMIVGYNLEKIRQMAKGWRSEGHSLSLPLSSINLSTDHYDIINYL